MSHFWKAVDMQCLAFLGARSALWDGYLHVLGLHSMRALVGATGSLFCCLCLIALLPRGLAVPSVQIPFDAGTGRSHRLNGLMAGCTFWTSGMP